MRKIYKNTANIYALTHCESYYNKLGIFTGRVDSVLTEEGCKHAKILARKLKNEKIDIAYTSSLTRTKQTLKYILKYHPKTKVVIDERIIERDYGKLSGKNKEKYKREHPDLFAVYHRSYDIPPPGGENMKQVEKRILSFIKNMLDLVKKEHINVLIMTHGNAIRPIRKYFEKLTNEQMMHLEDLRYKIFMYKIIL